MKFLNIQLLSNGRVVVKEPPIIYSGENESTAIRLYFEDKKYRDDSLFSKTITPLNNKIKVEDYTYKVFDSQFLLRHEHLFVGELYITIEVVEIPVLGMPEFKIKWSLDESSKMVIRPAKDTVVTADWKREYEDLIEEGYQSTLSSIRDNIINLNNDIMNLESNINDVNIALVDIENTKADKDTTYTKSEVEGILDPLNGRIEHLEAKDIVLRVWK